MSNVADAKQSAQGAAGSPLELAPDSWAPGAKADPLIRHNSGWPGASVSRLDGPLKVQGKAPFTAEFAHEGIVYAALVFSTIAKGRIATLDTSAAEAAPGVVLVMTHRNALRMRPMPLAETSPKAIGHDNLPIMQDDRVHWNGQVVAVVLAQTQEQADHAGSLIQVSYEPEPATTSFSQAKAGGTDTAELFGQPMHVEIGDAEAALAAATVSVNAHTARPSKITTPSSRTRPRRCGTATS